MKTRWPFSSGEGRLKNGEVQDGFIPGEGAAFLLLGQAGSGARMGMTPLARIVGVGLGQEPGHLYSTEPYRGEGLAQAFSAVLENVPQKPRVRTLYAGLNGENFWAKEFGVARVRHKDYFEEPVRVESIPPTRSAIRERRSGLRWWALPRMGSAMGTGTGPSLIYLRI